ncbi:MAG: peptidoglycan bridge formation glycyltransferase FemA/FemB family protein [Candidatus Brennerbacteria bacterium]|nr:peptidoglycan bridge formation glycyltransferase FemA/FemB family protein [Candidatus Brennerbacteria bacterium]
MKFATAQEWNDMVVTKGGSLLQSWEWGELQRMRGRDVLRFPSVSALVITMPLSLGRNYRYIPHGPSGVILNLETIRALTENAYSRRTIFLRIEPRVANTPEARGALAEAGFKRTPDTQPSETILVDLVKSEDELLRDMEHDTRYAIRVAERRGVTVEFTGGATRPAAFAHFWELFETTNARHGLRAYEKRYYELVGGLEGGCSSEIFSAKREGETIASAIVAYFGNTAYYLYAASRAGYGKYNAPSLLLWEIIRRAQARGYATLDLWGASATKKEWAGVTAFKKSFGGASVRFVGTWDYIYRPFWYAAYRFATAIRK